MRAWGIGWSRIANRSVVIFLLTSAVNVIVLALAGLGLTARIAGRASPALGLLPAAVALATLVLFLLLPRAIADTGIARRRGRVGVVLVSTARSVRDTEAILRKPDWRQFGNVGYLVFDIAALWACLRAVGTTPPLLSLVVAYQLGYLANILPIPGSVGVLEGGLVGALLLYGLPAGETATAVILYHAIALWIPALGGTIAFARLRHAITAGDNATGPSGRSALVSGSSGQLAVIAPPSRVVVADHRSQRP